MAAVKHEIKGEELLLLPEKAILWEEKSILLIADLHLGKITHFRKSGIGLPKMAESDNLERLAQLLLDYPVARVLLLGDLFHSEYNKEWTQFKRFLTRFGNISFTLVRGNHDILAEEAYEAPNLDVVDLLNLGPFTMTHIPLGDKARKGLYNIAGHIHPGVYLRGKGLQSMTLPCYHFSDHCLLLPAYGTFTGVARITPEDHDDVYAISHDSVIKVG